MQQIAESQLNSWFLPHRHPTLLPVVFLAVLGLWLSECNKLWVKIESKSNQAITKKLPNEAPNNLSAWWLLPALTGSCLWPNGYISACGWTLVRSSFSPLDSNLSQCIASLIQHNMGWIFLLKQQGASSASAATNAIGSRFLLGSSSSSSTSCQCLIHLDTGSMNLKSCKLR